MAKLSPSELKRQALEALLNGTEDEGEGAGVLSGFIKLSVEKMLQGLLEEEQTEYLGRDRYRRNGRTETDRPLYRNGYEPGKLKTAEGVLEVEKPQVRGGKQPYRSELWDRLAGTSEQLKQLVVEMYTRGMSTRDVESALEKSLGGFVLSRNSVSTLTADLLEEYERFRTRDLAGYDVAYLFLDTVYEPLRRYGTKTGVLCCWAYLTNGSKMLVDMSLSNQESTDACLEFLRELVKRGLQTPLTVTTDGAPGLIQAVEQVWPKSLRIRCWAHKMRNLETKVPPAVWPEFKALVHDIRDASSVEVARQYLNALVTRYQSELPEACRCLMDDSDASLRHLRVPKRHQQYVRTTNMIERTFVEQRRRTKVIPHFWDQQDLTKLVFGTLIRVSDQWRQAQFSQFEQERIRLLRKEILSDEQVMVQKPSVRRRSARRAA